MRLVRSSEPGAVTRDAMLRSLCERAVLTRMVCSELRDCGDPAHRRPQAALFVLLRWIAERHPSPGSSEPRADDGLDQITPADGEVDLLAEVRAGAAVCNALFMLFTADNGLQAADDRRRIATKLAEYFVRYSAPVRVAW